MNMMSLVQILTVSAMLASLATCDIKMTPKGFVKLPDRKGTLALNIGTANKAAYDDVHNILYVVGHTADVLNVIDMTNSLTEPTLARTITFDFLNQGYPNDIKLCRTTGGLVREFLAISFESKDLSERGHVHFYQPLSNPMDVLVRLKTVTAVEGFDPRSMAWNRGCSELVVASRGVPHTINGQFEDPKPAVDVLMPTFGLNVDRGTRPFSESAIKSADVRQVFTSCDTGTHTKLSTHVQDLEATHVAVDDNDIAYVLFQTNNAVGRLDLTDPFSTMEYHDLGLKNWGNLGIDTSYDDGDFSGYVNPSIAAAIKTNLSSYASLGRMYFSRLRSVQDGYNPLQMGFNYLTTYGGRGWSLYDVSSMTRVYDSGDILERYFLSADVKDNEKAMYNDYYYSATAAQSQYMDRTSPLFGPKPSAIATGTINGTQVVVVANGYVGGLYAFTVAANATHGPNVDFIGFQRRGSPGLTWDQAYKKVDDSVGEPGITDLIWINDEGQSVVVAISSIAGAASFYSVEVTP